MSGSVIESYGFGGGDAQSPPANSMQNVRLAYTADGAAVYKPTLPPPPPPASSSSPSSTPPACAPSGAAPAAGGGDGSVITAAQPSLNAGTVEPAKRKRGRPRKYPADGSVTPGLTSPPHTLGRQTPAQGAHSAPPEAENRLSSPSAGKKARGRPRGSGKNNEIAASGSAGPGFTPHIVTVRAGEDVLVKLMSFSQNNRRAVCVLSANGAISNVTLHQASTLGGTVTYEGRFEILSLCGSFMLSETSGQRSRTGGLSVLLSGPDGRVLGGGVAGLLIAAAPVQVVVGSFLMEGQKHSKQGQARVVGAPPQIVSGASAGGSSPSRATLSESSGGAGSPLDQSTETFNNSYAQVMVSMPWR